MVAASGLGCEGVGGGVTSSGVRVPTVLARDGLGGMGLAALCRRWNKLRNLSLVSLVGCSCFALVRVRVPKEPKEELELRCARSPRAPPTGKDLMVVTDMTSSFGEFWGDMARCVATGGSKRRDEPLKGTDRALASLVVVRAETWRCIG